MAQLRPCRRKETGEVDPLVKVDMNRRKMKLSRISKLLVDSDELSVAEAQAQRERFAVTFRCGPDVRQSRTLQLAVLTAASIATRCFPDAVKVELDEAVTGSEIFLPPLIQGSFAAALADLVGIRNLCVSGGSKTTGKVLLFGNAPPAPGSLRVTFDGWIAQVGPAASTDQLAERPYCALAGVLAGALAVSELFLSFAELNIAATRRKIGLSLWRPDLSSADPAAQGPQIEVLPRELWALGLGHIGNAYLWSLAALPYAKPEIVEIYLNDFDRVETENFETGLIFTPDDVDHLKSRVCSRWLEARGFCTRLVERPFDADFRCRIVEPPIEPRLALCGFDSNPARRMLPAANFARVMESGLGGTKHNFDTISFHALPNPRPAEELWPDLSPEEQEREREEFERIARENPAYEELGDDICGRTEHAGKSVAVPFVGVTAATLAVAEALRMLHDGPAYSDIKLSLSDLKNLSAVCKGNYTVQDSAGIMFCPASPSSRLAY
jgi:molybdopterin/thiamine biosynthesis adenylyltransferase